MKYLITCLLSVLSLVGFAQKVSPILKDAFKYDDVELLLSELKTQKATLNDCFDVEGSAYSLLALSVRMEKPKIFDALIAGKADLNKVCSDKNPLMYAAKYGKLEMAKALIKAGADTKLVNKDGETALDYAIKYKQKELETYLVSLKTTK